MKAIEEEQESMTDEPELYNSRAIRAFVSYIKKEYPYIDVNELFNYSEIKPKEVEDNKKWFTQKQINLFAEKLIELTGNETIGYDAGTFSAAPEAIGNYREYLLSFLSPGNVFKNIKSIVEDLTRSCEYIGKSIGQNRVEIRVVPNENVKETKMQCDNRLGYFEGVLNLYNITSFKIEHPECMFKENGDECKYIISWVSSSSDIIRKILRILPYPILIALFILFFIDILNNIFALLLTIILVSFLLKDWIENKLINTGKDNTRNAYQELMNEIDNNYRQSRVVLSVAESLSNEDNVFNKVIKILREQLGYNRGVIMLVNEKNNKRLCYKKSFGYNDDEIIAWNDQDGFDISRNNSEGAFVVSYKEKRPIWISDMKKIKPKLSKRSQKLVDRLNVKALICCPIIYKTDVYGIMAIDQKSDNIPFKKSDQDLLMSIARLLGIAINTSKQKKEKEILESKAAAKEAKEDFARRAMHNMRNPLDSIHTYIDCIIRDFKNTIDDDLKDILIKIESNVERIEQLSGDFSKWTKPLDMRMVNYSVSDTIQEVIDLFKTNQQNNPIQIFFKPYKSNLIGDKSSFKWIIEEMITNAQKNNATKISIELEHTDNSIIFYFIDDGDGIKKEIEDKLFEPFESTDYMGTGLGLACIKKMIEEHNGSVSYRDNNIGATFIIELPLDPCVKKKGLINVENKNNTY